VTLPPIRRTHWSSNTRVLASVCDNKRVKGIYAYTTMTLCPWPTYIDNTARSATRPSSLHCDW